MRPKVLSSYNLAAWHDVRIASTLIIPACEEKPIWLLRRSLVDASELSIVDGTLCRCPVMNWEQEIPVILRHLVPVERRLVPLRDPSHPVAVVLQ